MKQTKKVMSMVLCLAMLLSMMTAMTTMTAGAATETIVDLKFNLDEGEEVDTDQDQMDDRGEASADEEWIADGGHDGGAMTYTAKTDTPTTTNSSGNVVQVATRFFNGPMVKFEKHKTYTISFWMKASRDGIGSWIAPAGSISTVDLNDTNQTYGAAADSPTLSTEWKQYTFTISIKDFQAESKGATQGYVESSCVMANFKNYKAGDIVYVDDFTVTVTYDEAVSLDLSGTEKTVLSADDPENNTTKIVAKATDVFGNVIENPAVTYTSDNEEVAAVAADGTVTAHKNGVAIITAKSGEAEKSIVIIVGTKKSNSKGWEAGEKVGTSVTSETWGHPGYSWTEAQEIDTEFKRVGTGSFHLKNLNRPTVEQWDSTNKVYIADTVDTSKRGGKLSIGGGAADVSYGAQAYWFYTNNKPGNQWMQFYSNPTVDGETRFNFSISTEKAENYTGAGDGYTAALNYGIKQVPGAWHQVVQVTTPTGHKIYIDGELLIAESKTNQTLGSITIHRLILKDETTGTHELWIDDLAVVDIAVKHDVTVAVGENGTVNNGDAAVADGETIAVVDGESLTLTLIPEDGYEAKVTVDDQAVAVQEDNTVTVEKITADKTVNVSFEKIITEPSISGSSTDYIVSQTDYVHNNANHFAYVAYYKAAVPANHTVKSMGMNFGDGTNTVPLTVDQWTKDYMFGVRVFGEAVKEGKQYTFQGFAVMEDGDKKETTVKTDTVTK